MSGTRKKRGRKSAVASRGSTVSGPCSYGAFDSEIGRVYVAVRDGDVVALSFTSSSEEEFREEAAAHLQCVPSRSDAAVRRVVSELREYFKGRRTAFSVAPHVGGCTDFQRRVLKAAASIPYGQTRSYAWLAKEAGSPRAARAVGQVMARNPVPIIIPCHRVVGSSGGLCGFAGGLRALNLKRMLLAIEGVKV